MCEILHINVWICKIIEDSMIMSWLSDSMEQSISDTCMFYKTHKPYGISFIALTPRLEMLHKSMKLRWRLELRSKKEKLSLNMPMHCKHCERNSIRVFEMNCTANAIILTKFIEADRVYDFLAGLNEFDQARVQIIWKEEAPSLEETISLIWAEESKWSLMLDKQPSLNASVYRKIKTAEVTTSGRVAETVYGVPTARNCNTRRRVVGSWMENLSTMNGKSRRLIKLWLRKQGRHVEGTSVYHRGVQIRIKKTTNCRDQWIQ